MTFFSKNIDFLLKSTPATQESLAEYLGMRHTAVSSWKNDKAYPRADKIDKIAEYFGIKPSDLEYTDLTASSEMTITIKAAKNSNPNVMIGNTATDAMVGYNSKNNSSNSESEEVIKLRQRISFLEGQVQLLREILGK